MPDPAVRDEIVVNDSDVQVLQDQDLIAKRAVTADMVRGARGLTPGTCFTDDWASAREQLEQIELKLKQYLAKVEADATERLPHLTTHRPALSHSRAQLSLPLSRLSCSAIAPPCTACHARCCARQYS